MSIRQRLDSGLDRVKTLGATPTRIVLTEADLAELQPQTTEYRGVPVGRGQIGGSSYIETRDAPSGDTNFAV